MQLTVEQALQQGIAAHKNGDLPYAERFYRAILKSQPAHAHANHNLGVLKVSQNLAGAALPLFQIALKANPNIEQFWLSYIGALIQEKQVEEASEALSQANKHGVSFEKAKILNKII